MEIVVAIISSSAFTAIVSNVCSYLINKRQKNDAVVQGVQMLMYHELKVLGREYIAQGHISSDDLEDYIRMHKVYHGPLDGNGFLDSLLKQVTRLPIKN